MTQEGKNQPDLVTRWRVALMNARVTQSDWAAQYDLTEGHVSQVVSEKRQSPSVMERVVAFIEEQERLIAERVPVETPTAA